MRSARWAALYVVLVCWPIVAGAIGGAPARSAAWWAEAAAAVGLAALAVLMVQLALISRFGTLSRDIGLDALMQFHREMAVVGLAAVAGHVVLLGGAAGWRALNPLAGSAGSALGAAALWLLVIVAITSFGRRRLGLSYEAWQAIHLAGAVAILATMIGHALMLGRYSAMPLVRATLVAYALAFLGLLAWSRVVRRARLLRTPWEVTANDDAGGSTRLLTLRPVGHPGFRFAAGQFVWLTTGRSPILSPQHPLSIASAPAALEREGRLELAIKAAGDWSGTEVPALRPGHRAWMDGPFGGFTPGPGGGPVVLIAGGIGIAPIRSILLAARAAGDARPYTLFYAAASLARMVFRQELDALSREMALMVVPVLENPPAGWTGERGFLTADLLRRHAPVASATAEYFVCGPLPMIDSFDAIRAELGIARRRVHTERFHLV
jgi:predicted ferric reductase